MKYEWRKAEKQFYMPQKVTYVTVPGYQFITLKGAGNPNTATFSEQISALYSLAYALRMKLKKGLIGAEPFEYTVYPLEGVWTTRTKPTGPIDKNDLIYQIMIRQPAAITQADFETALAETIEKKPNPWLTKVQFVTYEEGQAIQALHVGPYEMEQATFALMQTELISAGYQVVPTMGDFWHREIYLSDARRVTPDKQKTVLRYRIEKNNR